MQWKVLSEESGYCGYWGMSLVVEWPCLNTAGGISSSRKAKLTLVSTRLGACRLTNAGKRPRQHHSHPAYARQTRYG